jgi:predicted transcriptional regulator
LDFLKLYLALSMAILVLLLLIPIALLIAKRVPHFSIATVHENLEKALLMGLVAREGRYYILTDKGREFLKTAIEEIKKFAEEVEKVI